MSRHFIERNQRAGDALAIEPGLRLYLIPGRNRREREPRQPLHQLSRHSLADLSQPGNGDTFGRQI
jgi:hypothetical protein